MPGRGPSLWEMPGSDPAEGDPRAQPIPDYMPAYEFDLRIAWSGKRRQDSLVGGDSCLWPPGRQTSAVKVATGERWHRRCREEFSAELDGSRIGSLEDLNARLWAWLEQVYHRTPHHGLDGVTPLARYQQDLPRIRTLGALATDLDALFHHRVSRQVRRDGTVSYLGAHFEVPYELSGAKVALVVDPHTARVIGVEDAHGKHLGAATPLDAAANLHRVRHRPPVPATGPAPGSTALSAQRSHPTPNLVEIAHAAHYGTPED